MKLRTKALMLFLVFALPAVTGCAGPLSKREQGGLLGAGAGAASGAIIGSTVGHAAAGAAIGGPIGLIGGAVIGDYLMQQDRRQLGQRSRMEQSEAELEWLRKENERLRRRER